MSEFFCSTVIMCLKVKVTISTVACLALFYQVYSPCSKTRYFCSWHINYWSPFLMWTILTYFAHNALVSLMDWIRHCIHNAPNASIFNLELAVCLDVISLDINFLTQGYLSVPYVRFMYESSLCHCHFKQKESQVKDQIENNIISDIF